MADTAIFSSLTISLPSVIVTLGQVQKEVCVWVCVWMKLDDDWMHGGRKKKHLLSRLSLQPLGTWIIPEWSLHFVYIYFYNNVNEDLSWVQDIENCEKN